MQLILMLIRNEPYITFTYLDSLTFSHKSSCSSYYAFLFENIFDQIRKCLPWPSSYKPYRSRITTFFIVLHKRTLYFSEGPHFYRSHSTLVFLLPYPTLNLIHQYIYSLIYERLFLLIMFLPLCRVDKMCALLLSTML